MKCMILSFSIPIFPTFSGKSFSAVLVSWHRGQVVLSQVLGLEKHLEEINVSMFDSEDLPETFPKVATSLWCFFMFFFALELSGVGTLASEAPRGLYGLPPVVDPHPDDQQLHFRRLRSPRQKLENFRQLPVVNVGIITCWGFALHVHPSGEACWSMVKYASTCIKLFQFVFGSCTHLHALLHNLCFSSPLCVTLSSPCAANVPSPVASGLNRSFWMHRRPSFRGLKERRKKPVDSQVWATMHPGHPCLNSITVVALLVLWAYWFRKWNGCLQLQNFWFFIRACSHAMNDTMKYCKLP